VLFAHPTIRELAAEIDRKPEPVASEAASNELFATLRKTGRDTPLFLIHGGDGGVMFYQALVEKLVGLDAPVYAIESPSLNRRDLTVPDLDTLVANYLEMIRAKQPDGPYRIGGYSFGGVVAFEIASRMQAQGLTVKLVIFDSANPQDGVEKRHGFWRRIDVAWKRYESDGLPRRFGKMARRITARRVDDRVRQEKIRRFSGSFNNGTLTALEDRAFYLNELYQQLLVNYTPSGSVNDALLIKSSADTEGADLPQDYGWGAVIGKLEMIVVPADHFTLFAPQAVDRMVAELQRYLA
jgi:thioesterase domain-containing protein